jgi:hypothetical protein
MVGIFSGHIHRSTTGHVGKVPASVVQCIATSLRRGEYPEHMTSRPVYHIHWFEPGEGVSTQSRIVDAA